MCFQLFQNKLFFSSHSLFLSEQILSDQKTQLQFIKHTNKCTWIFIFKIALSTILQNAKKTFLDDLNKWFLIYL